MNQGFWLKSSGKIGPWCLSERCGFRLGRWAGVLGSKTGAVRRGFSLIELLVMIAVIGVLTAIVVVKMGSVFGTARETVDRRNAQNLAMVASTVESSGDRTLTEAGSLEAAVLLLVAGPEERGSRFRVSGLSAGDVAGAMRYLRFESGQVLYRE